MSAGKINLQAADGAVIGLVVPDGLTSGERQIALGSNTGSLVPYHLLQGSLAVSNSTITQGMNTTLYTGNGATQNVTTGIDMDTQWGSTAEEKFGGLVWLKSRSSASNNYLFDSLRGNSNPISSNGTASNTDYVTTGRTCTYSNNGFIVGSEGSINGSGYSQVSWNFQTTHRITGTTNHGKAYTCHYNPFTGFTIVKYEGSGIAGHEIPHHLGRKLGAYTFKNLSTTGNWLTVSDISNTYQYLNLTNAGLSSIGIVHSTEYNTIFDIQSIDMNASTNQYIMYGWANSYYDEADKLIGNYELVTYQGTGASGNKVKTRGKPAWVMVKRVDSTANWFIFNNLNTNNSIGGIDGILYANLNGVETATADRLTILSDGWIWNTGIDPDMNASGGQYIALVAYDTNANGGGSYYPLASDTANVQVNNALIPLAKGIDGNGVKNSIVVANETITGVTYTAGKNYLYKTDSGYGVKNIAPNYGKINPANGGDFYNVITNKWFTSAGVEITESRNYMNHIVHADNDGGVLYVEELPKIEYKDIIKANEYQGKNACTAWVNFDGTTTPPTKKDGYEVSSVIKTNTASYDLYFETQMENLNYGVSVIRKTMSSYTSNGINYTKYLNKVNIELYEANTQTSSNDITVIITGGKN